MSEKEELIAEARRLIALGQKQIAEADKLLKKSKKFQQLREIELEHAIQRLQTEQVGRHR